LSTVTKWLIKNFYVDEMAKAVKTWPRSVAKANISLCTWVYVRMCV